MSNLCSMELSISNLGWDFRNSKTAVLGLLPGPHERSGNISLSISSINVSKTTQYLPLLTMMPLFHAFFNFLFV